ncbi:anti-sigma K factor RskA [Aliidongia dinghuensis]|uniref:Regulator of SigK n=1 Tax=Aliidongia dinghuensis TaxID=1867774 RepID=A0A8J3E6W6_9PROT|nr:anti-sigma factor [Aliidongia dinghuensis]GGF45556.1 anti-sigma K factor RskA [Aliidongia dinghuensis]
MSDEPDDMDTRAAEYVLGLLSPDETAAVQRALELSPALAEAVARWEALLTPLAAALPPEPPPAALWDRIAAGLDANAPPGTEIVPLRPRRLLQSTGFWRATTALAAALAASLAIVVIRTPAPTVHYVAAIAPTQGPAATWLAETRADGALVVTAVGRADRSSGKDLELWALAKGAQKPVSLGVLPASGAYVVAAADLPRDQLQLMVSLEPAGGSPTGQPTGPVLYAGALTRTE